MGKPSKSDSKSDTLDLHGFTKDEVIAAIDAFLMNANRLNRKTVKIMTGKGKGIVKKEAVRYLKQAGYPWKYEKLNNGQNNEGVLVVFVD